MAFVLQHWRESGLTMAGIKTSVKIEGLKEFEANLKILREEFGVRTGGIIIRGLRAAAKIVRAEAKRRAPKQDPSGFLKEREAKLAAQKAGKRFKGRFLKSKTKALIRANIVEHALKVSDPRSEGQPTVIVRVRNKGYTRDTSGRLKFNNPESSPGYWWWIEFGTSKFAARPFIRPAFEATKHASLEAFKNHMKKEIQKLYAKFKITRAA